MKIFVFIILLFLFPIKVYGKLNDIGVSCVTPNFEKIKKENTIVLMTFWFNLDSKVKESWVLKEQTGVEIKKFVKTRTYYEEINFIKWDRHTLNRTNLELSYTGGGRVYKRNCSIFNSLEEMDVLLDKYYRKTKRIVNEMKKDNKI